MRVDQLAQLFSQIDQRPAELRRRAQDHQPLARSRMGYGPDIPSRLATVRLAHGRRDARERRELPE